MSGTGRVAVAVVVLIATAGEWIAPHDPVRPVGQPWSGPDAKSLLGTDSLGRDVLSRVLAGGRDLVMTSLLAACVAVAVGTVAGLFAAWAGGWADRVLRGCTDLLLAVPAVVSMLVVAVAVPGRTAVVVGTVIAGAPLTVLVVRDAARRVVDSGFVQAARTRGEHPVAVVGREVLPVLTGLVAADTCLRMVTALQLAAALGVLGYGSPPPLPDWSVMLQENLAGAALNPLGVVVPAALLAAVALAVAALARSLSADLR